MFPPTLGSLAMAAAVPVSTTCGLIKPNSMVVVVIGVCAAVRIYCMASSHGDGGRDTLKHDHDAKGTARVTVVTALEGDTVCKVEIDRGIATLSGLKAQIKALISNDPSMPSEFHLIHIYDKLHALSRATRFGCRSCGGCLER